MNNVTLDDTSSQLIYSAEWRRQPVNDDNYFMGTYRASQKTGDTMTLRFRGSAIQIYGSKGPNHGNYSVQFDDTIIFLPGHSNDVLYQELLYSEEVGGEDEHDVVLTNREDFWLDVDFVIVTRSDDTEGVSDPGAFETTVTPATQPTRGSSPSTLSDGSTPLPPNSTGSIQESGTNLFLILTVVFATLLGVILAVVLALCWWKRRRDYRNAREMSFRYGHKPRSLHLPTAATTPGSSGRLANLGNALLGIVPGSDRTTSPVSGGFREKGSSHHQNVDTSGAPMNITSPNNDLIALSNFGKRPGYKAGGPGSSAGESGETVASNGGGWKSGPQTPASMSSPSTAGWNNEQEALVHQGFPHSSESNLSASAASGLSGQTGQRTLRGKYQQQQQHHQQQQQQLQHQHQQFARNIDIGYTPSYTSPSISSDVTATSSDAALYARRQKEYLALSSGTLPSAGSGSSTANSHTGLRPPPVREVDRDRLERLQQHPQQAMMTTNRGNFAINAPNTNARNPYTKVPPSYGPPAGPLPPAPMGAADPYNNGHERIATGGTLGRPIMSNFDRDLELRGRTSPAVGGSVGSRTPDLFSGSLRARSDTPDRMGRATAAGGGRSYSPRPGWDGT